LRRNLLESMTNNTTYPCGPPPVPGALYGYVPASITVALLVIAVVHALIRSIMLNAAAKHSVSQSREEKLNATAKWSFPYYILRFIPAGRDTIAVEEEDGDVYLNVKLRRFCYCSPATCCMGKELRIRSPHVVSVSEQKLPFCQIWKFLIAFSLSFVYALLLHLVVASYVGVEVSLGSVEMHQKLGMVWFGQWPFYLLFFILIRNPCVEVRYYRSENDTRTRKVYVCVPDSNDRSTIASAIRRRLRDSPAQSKGPDVEVEKPLKKSIWHTRIPAFTGMFTLFLLLVNGFVVGGLILKCQSYGKCKC